MYSKLPNLVIGFHGCDKKICDRVLSGSEGLKASINTYDWLGNGIYFWEQNLARAQEWAEFKYKKNAAVIGAVLDLGYCLNLADSASNVVLESAYSRLVQIYDALDVPIPENKPGKNSKDELLRHLDCAVIQQVHDYNRQVGAQEFDSVRGVFTEGRAIYPGAAILEKTHVQICVRNPNCIKGYFRPLSSNVTHLMP